jgi:hypothetical protein
MTNIKSILNKKIHLNETKINKRKYGNFTITSEEEIKLDELIKEFIEMFLIDIQDEINKSIHFINFDENETIHETYCNFHIELDNEKWKKYDLSYIKDFENEKSTDSYLRPFLKIFTYKLEEQLIKQLDCHKCECGLLFFTQYPTIIITYYIHY